LEIVMEGIKKMNECARRLSWLFVVDDCLKSRHSRRLLAFGKTRLLQRCR